MATAATDLPDSRDALDAIAIAIARQSERREEAALDLSDLLSIRVGSAVPWKRWIADAGNREMLNHLVASLSLALRVPEELRGYPADPGAIAEDRVASVLKRAQAGNLDVVRSALGNAPRWRGLQFRVMKAVREVDGGDLAKALGEAIAAAGKLREVEAMVRARLGAPKAKPGRPPRNVERNRAVLDLYATDPTIGTQGVLAALKGRFPTLTQGVIYQILHYAKSQGELAQDLPEQPS